MFPVKPMFMPNTHLSDEKPVHGFVALYSVASLSRLVLSLGLEALTKRAQSAEL
jgi:hypothetical protein